MALARFSPFELLLLKSRHQTDTAGLLLMAWVLASKGHITDPDRQRFADLAHEFRHGHDLEPLIEIAVAQDLAAIQLAAEVLHKDSGGERAYPFLRQATALAVNDGKLTTANYHILCFLADLLGVAPAEFAALFEATTGKAFEAPEDPSRTAYWQAKERQQGHREQSQERSEQAQQDEHQQYGSREERHEEREQQQKRKHEYSWQRNDYRHHQRHEQHSRAHQSPPPNDRTRRALAVLGLEPGASRNEIRKAYRRLAQLHHPDRVFAKGEAMTASASQRFQRIKKAYDYLMEAS
ncbi:DnaJ domain-containing protein [Aidingimonas lacisalsi]|uniref:DnaJ domain-containing protein n=1 Tax=Aidingimonas lacisalsi TaxID=2604086 RepID=UPI0011D191C0|nr:DnaJ domain-containing protein [Aidingimonas lacisalsi]